MNTNVLHMTLKQVQFAPSENFIFNFDSVDSLRVNWIEVVKIRVAAAKKLTSEIKSKSPAKEKQNVENRY